MGTLVAALARDRPAAARARGWSVRCPSRATAQTPARPAGACVGRQARRATTCGCPSRGPTRWGSSIAVRPREAFLAAAADAPTECAFELRAAAPRPLRPAQRPPCASRIPWPWPRGRRPRGREHVLLVYPRFYTLESFAVPAGRRYQPGGIPLSSSTGDAIEFVGTREYREGDPVRNIHWRSWARRGEPVVKEYQEEYFARIALVLDTFVPPRPRAAGGALLRGGHLRPGLHRRPLQPQRYVVDILAAGPEVYEVSAGRSLAYLDNILDVLAGLEPCRDAALRRHRSRPLREARAHHHRVAVLQDWDEPRERFLREVKALGTAVP